jgi:broad specificity phosphatase PhoE
VTIYLVRHAHAGSRRKWVGRDELRPQDDKGMVQADGLAAALADAGLTHLYSSPSTRCTQTLQPLSDKIQLPVETNPALAEGAPATLSLALVQKHLGDTVAFCTHGDVIENVLGALVQRGMDADVGQSTRKGGCWVIQTEGDHFTDGRYQAPVND